MDERASVEKLNQLGDDGWELVSFVPVERTGTWTQRTATYAFAFIFKRAKQIENRSVSQAATQV